MVDANAADRVALCLFVLSMIWLEGADEKCSTTDCVQAHAAHGTSLYFLQNGNNSPVT